MIKKYFKKPVQIQAYQFDGRNGFTIQKQFCPNFVYIAKTIPNEPDQNGNINYNAVMGEFKWYVRTLEGDLEVREGDFIIKGVRGEFYSCRQDIFKETYQEIINVPVEPVQWGFNGC